MNLVVIYGAPAVGKLTVAKELARLTGFKVLHNHLTIDVARAIFEFGSPSFARLLHRLRIAVIEEAAAENIDLVLTISYHHSEATEASARASIEEVEAFGARVSLVHLTCTQEGLEARVTAAERVAMKKLHSVEALRSFMQGRDYESGFPAPNTLRIDNTNLPPEDVARRIAEHFGVRVV
jgi:shikimate kinase